MDIEHLKYFKTVAEIEHITRSAELLHISQPSLSKAISNVEAFAGVQLFDREKSKICLNQNGRIFLRQLNLFFDTLEAARAEIARDSALETGVVRIAASVGSGCLNDYLLTLHERYPEIRLTHYVAAERDMAQSLLQKELDIAVSMEPLDEYAPLIRSKHLITEEMLVLFPEGHPLSGESTITPDQIMHERFVVNNNSSQLQNRMSDFFRKSGISPNVVFDSSSPDLVGSILQSSPYLTIIPSSSYYRTSTCMQHEAKAIHNVLHITGDRVTRTLYLNYQEDFVMSKAAELVLEELPGYFSSLPH